jgi:phosphoserine phosphatase
MTKEEIGELVAALPEGLDADEFIYKLVNWAVDREREACAKVCEDLIGTRAMARHCADAIRARGGEK